ncbi:Uncharacterised protein [Bordetella pertussis]|nr:Uncharacterised protein [Bordetella pertussis]CFO68304.1 Uncharacterised protein [Bordetella pertussis]CFU80859.1 Uncharacterised protein [Bordetella pertussis]CPH85021.1 Uncharacterised protein [Bordetella pertussis]CPK54244.1 Uncharacterised protein [Bordetella pertussis]
MASFIRCNRYIEIGVRVSALSRNAVPSMP